MAHSNSTDLIMFNPKTIPKNSIPYPFGVDPVSILVKTNKKKQLF